MNFSAELPAGRFAEAISRAAALAPDRGTMPILSHALLCGEGGKLSIAATNMDCGLANAIEARAEGAVTASAARLSAIAARLEAEEPVKLTQDDSALHIAQGRTRYKLPWLPREEFPEAAAAPLETGEVWKLPAATLLRHLKAVEGAINPANASFPALGGAFFDFAGESGPALIATDTFQLALIALSEWAPPKGAPGIIIPAAAFGPIADIAKRHKELTLTINDRAASVEANGERFRTQLCAGLYPDVRRFIPAEHATRVTFGAAEMRRAIERAAVIEGDPAGPKKQRYTFLRLEIGPGEIEMTSRNSAGEEGQAVCAAEISQGGPQSLQLQAPYLAWAIASFGEAERLIMDIKDSVTPIVLTRANDPERKDLRLIMPRQR